MLVGPSLRRTALNLIARLGRAQAVLLWSKTLLALFRSTKQLTTLRRRRLSALAMVPRNFIPVA